jgi:hypothetical protein
LQGDVHALIDQPFDKVQAALADPKHWCDILDRPPQPCSTGTRSRLDRAQCDALLRVDRVVSRRSGSAPAAAARETSASLVRVYRALSSSRRSPATSTSSAKKRSGRRRRIDLLRYEEAAPGSRPDVALPIRAFIVGSSP